MSTNSIQSNKLEKCILECKDAQKFYDFPDKMIMRNVWLFRFGFDLDTTLENLKACDRHFSSKMFHPNEKLKSYAVPDLHLPIVLNPDGTVDEAKTRALRKQSQKQNSSNRNNTKSNGELKQTNVSRVNSNKAVAMVKARQLPKLAPKPATVVKSAAVVKPATVAKSAANIRPAPVVKPTPVPQPEPPAQVQPWINDTSNLLVDYQLKVRGQHLCDVIEIPQYVVVFTVIRGKQKAHELVGGKRKKRFQTVKQFTCVKEPQASDIITIDDDDPIVLSQPRSLRKSPALLPTTPMVTRSKSSKVVQTETAVLQPQTSNVIQPTLTQIEPTEVPSIVQDIPQKNFEAVQQTFFPQIQPQVLSQIFQQNQINVVPDPAPEPEVVFYTDEDLPPRRDRAIQVNLVTKYTDTDIQCDFELDYDIMQMQRAPLLQSKAVSRKIALYECQICGEILNTLESKMKHAREHERTPSLCWQCGEIFDCPMSLKNHTKNFHSNYSNSKKLQRCPKRNCNKAFLSKVLLDNHIREHVLTRGHKCNKCLQTFRSPLKLICHQKALDKCLRTRGWTSKRWSKRI